METKCKIYGYPFNITGQMLFGCFHSAGECRGSNSTVSERKCIVIEIG